MIIRFVALFFTFHQVIFMYNAKQELKALKLLIQLQEYIYMYN